MESINYWAVLVSAVVYWLLGGIWYAGIFNLSSLMGWDEAEMEAAKQAFPKSLVVYFISGLVMSYVMAHLVRYTHATTAMGGVIAGFWTWLGFQVPIALNQWFFERRPAKVVFINIGNYLISLLAIGVILAIWR